MKPPIGLFALVLSLGFAAVAAAKPGAEPAPLYRIHAEIVRPDSREVLETTVTMPGRAEITSTGEDPHRMTVELRAAPGPHLRVNPAAEASAEEPPPGRVYLEADIRRVNGPPNEVVARPHMVIEPGGTARIEVGDEATQVFRMTISPAT